MRNQTPKTRKPPRPYRRRPSFKQINTLKILVDTGCSVASAMRQGGYSPKTARVPGKFTDTIAYADLMKKMGMDDERLAQIHDELLNQVVSEERRFNYTKDGKKWLVQSDEEIVKIIELIPGQVVAAIQDFPRSHKLAIVLKPETNIRSRMLSEAYKVQGKYAAQKLQFNPDPLNPEEETTINIVFGNNKNDRKASSR